MPTSDDLAFGRFVVRPQARQLLIDNEPAKLGARAFDVLLALIERRDRFVGKNELLDLAWPGLVVEENNLSVQISTLRKLLGPQAIATVPGRGYRFSLVPQQAAAGPAARAAAATAPPAGGAVAQASPALLGRDDELNALGDLVRASRLVTVVGAGGIGKTTVARALAHRIAGSFEGGVFLVELAPVSDASLVMTTVATALDAKIGNRTPLEAIAGRLGSGRILVVLDNCEHLVQAVAELVEALSTQARGTHWLVTSQERLRLAAEQVFRIGPLALPTEQSLGAARQAGAVALFEARARAADPRFMLTADNVAATIEICRRLDGIALAIELAAARVPLLGIEGLRRRLGERFRVLAGGNRLALARHQRLRAALEWSYGLLTEPQQAVFRRLGVFVGTFALDAAQQVAADESIDPWAVLDALGYLTDKSLVVAEPDTGDEPRYRLLETMREYALDRIEAAGELGPTRSRHLDVFVALAEQSKGKSLGPQQRAWMRRLDLDFENLLAAHAWCGRIEAGGERDLRLVTGLYRFLRTRGLFSLGFRVTLEALGRAGAERRDRLRREALTQAGGLGTRAGLFEQAAQAHEEAIAIARETGDPAVLANALTDSGVGCVERGDLAGARAQLEEALLLARALGTGGTAFARAANQMGELERLQGNFARAQSLYEAALVQARSDGDLFRVAACLNNVVSTAIAQGRTTGLREPLLESVTANSEVASWRPFPLILGAGFAAARGDWERSARWLGAAELQFEQLEHPLDPPDKAFVESIKARTRSALGDAAYEGLIALGRGLPLQEALGQMQQYATEQS